jgi:hypothetical protein
MSALPWKLGQANPLKLVALPSPKVGQVGVSSGLDTPRGDWTPCFCRSFDLCRGWDSNPHAPEVQRILSP